MNRPAAMTRPSPGTASRFSSAEGRQGSALRSSLKGHGWSGRSIEKLCMHRSQHLMHRSQHLMHLMTAIIANGSFSGFSFQLTPSRVSPLILVYVYVYWPTWPNHYRLTCSLKNKINVNVIILRDRRTPCVSREKVAAVGEMKGELDLTPPEIINCRLFVAQKLPQVPWLS